jgi:hypothetical protein
LSDAHFYGAKTTYGALRYLQVPLDHLKKMFFICVLWRDPLGIKLGHCSCGPSELDKEVVILLLADLNLDGVQFQLDHELGVDMELVEHVFIPH